MILYFYVPITRVCDEQKKCTFHFTPVSGPFSVLSFLTTTASVIGPTLFLLPHHWPDSFTRVSLTTFNLSASCTKPCPLQHPSVECIFPGELSVLTKEYSNLITAALSLNTVNNSPVHVLVTCYHYSNIGR